LHIESDGELKANCKRKKRKDVDVIFV
jgi:hypothetical protein